MPRFVDKSVTERIKILSVILPISTDTYDEGEVEKKITSENKDVMFAVALQFSIIGMGNKNFGTTSINEKVFDVKKLCLDNDIKIDVPQGAKLLPADLTPKRLSRFFRFHISDYIRDTKNVSFLYRKYGVDEAVSHFTFPGAEYMVEGEHVQNLINTYARVDALLKSNFAPRMVQICRARSP